MNLLRYSDIAYAAKLNDKRTNTTESLRACAWRKVTKKKPIVQFSVLNRSNYKTRKENKQKQTNKRTKQTFDTDRVNVKRVCCSGLFATSVAVSACNSVYLA